MIVDRNIDQARYRIAVDPRSAHEVLLERIAARQIPSQEAEFAEPAVKTRGKSEPRSRSRQSAGEAFLKSMARAAGSSLGRKLLRGVLGSLLK